MKKSFRNRGKIFSSNPKFSTIHLTLSKKNNTEIIKVVSANSKFITVENGRASLNLRQISKGKWAVVSGKNIDIPDNAPKMTTSTGPKRNIKKVL